MTTLTGVLICLLVLACPTCLLNANGLAIEEKLQQLEKHYMETTAVLEAKIASLEAKMKQQEPLSAELENQEIPLQTQQPATHRTCFEMKTDGSLLDSGMQWIDPDGKDSGDEPIHVYCEFETGATSILHDSESMTNVVKCHEPGCYSRQINYEASEKQMAALAELSSECHQSIRYDCTGAPLHFNGVTYSWWNDRNGNPRYFWSGNQTDAHTCQCGIDGNCDDPSMTCNCDTPTKRSLTDSGIITDKEILPVTKLNFGRTLLKSSSGAHTLGRFACSGQSTLLNEMSRHPMPTSCEDLQQIGHNLKGIYSVMKNKTVKTIYCDFTPVTSETLLPFAQTSVPGSYLKRELNEISRRFAEEEQRLTTTETRVEELATKLNMVEEKIGSIRLKSSCYEKETSWESIGDNGDGALIFLDRHFVSCGMNEFIASFKFERRPHFDEARFNVKCCFYHL